MNKNYKEWMENAPEAVKEEIKNYSQEQIDERFSKHMSFGTAGIRGPILYGTNNINEYTLARNAWAFGKVLLEKDPENAKKHGVLIAHDNRKNRILFSETVAKVLSALGIPVKLFKNNELQPTPLVSFIINKYDFVGGAIVTASHNPASDNGFKVYNEFGSQFIPKYTDRIQEIAPTLENVFEIPMNDDLISELDDKFIDEYIDTIMKEIPFTKGTQPNRENLKVTFTSQHGTSTKIAIKLAELMRIDMKLVEEQSFADENFTNTTSPNPQNPEAFDLAKIQGDEDGSTLLFATDPDADRFGLVVKHNGKWVHLSGNELPVIQMHWKLTKLKEMNYLKPGMHTIRSIVSSSFGDKVVESFGVKMFKTLTGFKWLVDKSMEQEKKGNETLFAYEEAYGSVVRMFSHDKDSFQAFVQVIEIADELQKEGKTFVDYLEELYKEFGHYKMFQDTKRFEGILAQKEMNDFIDSYRKYSIGDSFGEFKITDIWDFKNGYKDYEAGNFIFIHLDNKHWFCLRPSGTEPLLRIYYDLVDIDEKSVQNLLK